MAAELLNLKQEEIEKFNELEQTAYRNAAMKWVAKEDWQSKEVKIDRELLANIQKLSSELKPLNAMGHKFLHEWASKVEQESNEADI